MADYGADQFRWEHGILKGHENHGCKWDRGGSFACPNWDEDGDMLVETNIDETNVKNPYPDEVNPKDLVGIKKAAVHLVPPALRLLAAPAMQDGAEKYGPYNWREKAVKMSVYLAAAQRHIDAYWDGEELAEDSGIDHLSHAAACLAIIADARAIGKLVDDRPVPGGAPKLLKEQDRS